MTASAAAAMFARKPDQNSIQNPTGLLPPEGDRLLFPWRSCCSRADATSRHGPKDLVVLAEEQTWPLARHRELQARPNCGWASLLRSIMNNSLAPEEATSRLSCPFPLGSYSVR